MNRMFSQAIVVALLADFVCGSVAYGQAYCALRDPTRRIYESWPQATTYKSIVRTIDERVRRQVAGSCHSRFTSMNWAAIRFICR